MSLTREDALDAIEAPEDPACFESTTLQAMRLLTPATDARPGAAITPFGEELMSSYWKQLR